MKRRKLIKRKAKMKEPSPLFLRNKFYCPGCNRFYMASLFFTDSVNNLNTRWLTNMISHMRDHPLHHMEKMIPLSEYDSEDRWMIVEFVKRQILLQYLEYMRQHGMKRSDFYALNNKDRATLELIEKSFLV